MVLYFLLALFWASVILYIIGLAMGIFKYEHKETTIVCEEKQDVESYEQSQQEHQREKFEQQEQHYEETPQVNMQSIL